MDKKIPTNDDSPQDGFDFIEYPCEFNFKAMAKSNDQIEKQLCQLVADVVSDNNVLSSKLAKSRTGKFASVIITARLQNRDELEAVYKALSECPEVLMTL